MSHIPHGHTTERLRMYRRGFWSSCRHGAAGVAATPIRLEAASPHIRSRRRRPSFETWLNRIPESKEIRPPEPNSGMPVSLAARLAQRQQRELRHEGRGQLGSHRAPPFAIPIAMQDALGRSYKLGDVFGSRTRRAGDAQRLCEGDAATAPGDWRRAATGQRARRSVCATSRLRSTAAWSRRNGLDRLP